MTALCISVIRKIYLFTIDNKKGNMTEMHDSIPRYFYIDKKT